MFTLLLSRAGGRKSPSIIFSFSAEGEALTGAGRSKVDMARITYIKYGAHIFECRINHVRFQHHGSLIVFLSPIQTLTVGRFVSWIGP